MSAPFVSLVNVAPDSRERVACQKDDFAIGPVVKKPVERVGKETFARVFERVVGPELEVGHRFGARSPESRESRLNILLWSNAGNGLNFVVKTEIVASEKLFIETSRFLVTFDRLLSRSCLVGQKQVLSSKPSIRIAANGEFL